MDKRYRWVIVGGTFDHFHQGHKHLLTKAFSIGEKVDIGLTKDSFLAKKAFSLAVEKYERRREKLKVYLKENGWLDRAKTIPLTDSFGPSIKEKKYQAIVVSSQTKATAHLINKIRQKRGLLPLDIIEINFIKGEDGQIISSKRIRRGEIDRMGKNYELMISRYWREKNKPLIISEDLKVKLRQPLGKVFSGDETQILKMGKKLVDYIRRYQPVLTIAVGDMISYSLIKNQLVPSIQIIDYKSRKKELSTRIKSSLEGGFSFKIVNQSGGLSFQAFITVKLAVENFLTNNKKETIFVDGEEDLLVLPAIIFSPLKTLIFYGHWQYGVIAVEVVEEKKDWAIECLKEMRKNDETQNLKCETF